MFAQFKLDDDRLVSIPVSKIDKIYGAIDGLQSVTVIKVGKKEIILHWNRAVEFSDKSLDLGDVNNDNISI